MINNYITSTKHQDWEQVIRIVIVFSCGQDMDY